MRDAAHVPRVFISCATDEFEKPAALFPFLRSQLEHYLSRAGCKVEVQEKFRQAGDVDTIRKLDGYIRTCTAVIHLVGGQSGAVADGSDVAAYLAAEPTFFANRGELRRALGDGADLTYTEWEAFIALHHGVPLFVYAADTAAANHGAHLDRLRAQGKYPAPITGISDLLGQLIGDIHAIVPSVPKLERKIAASRILRHSPAILFGRDAELDALDEAWHSRPTLNVYPLIAWGGAGKTSVVAHWMARRMAAKAWPFVERYFDWSFYSQGAREGAQANADLFIAEALEFFGDSDPQAGSSRDRGERLARLVRQQRTLLVLDGIEPLQYPPNSPQAGVLKDEALAALLQGLAMDNPGLCVVTSREALTDLQSFHGGTVEERRLDKLPPDAAIALLRHLKVVGTDDELTEAWKDAGGHALTLQLLGRFIAQAFADRDIRHRREVHLTDADRETGRGAMKVLARYENWLESAGPEGQRHLAVLRLTGLFDRPASDDCLGVLRQWKFPSLARRLLSGKWRQIHRVFGPLASITGAQWHTALRELAELDLITSSTDDAAISRTAAGDPRLSIDAHPLVREYFAAQLKKNHPDAFRAAHSRLFDHLCATTEHQPDTLAGLQPLYQAVVHGCLAGRQQEAGDAVYLDRILRGTGAGGFYSSKKLGAIGADLGAVAAFFDEPWSKMSPNLSAADQAWLLNQAGFYLRALGRLAEAVDPMRVGMNRRVETEDWHNAAISASNLSGLEVTLGRLGDAVADGRRAIDFADRSMDAFQRMGKRTTAADALHQAGEQAEAAELFAAAEQMQSEMQPEFPLLYSLPGFRYADLLLAPAERAAWRAVLRQQASQFSVSPQGDDAVVACAEAERRSTRTLELVTSENWLLDIALDHLTLVRARLYRALLVDARAAYVADLGSEVSAALGKLRQANTLDDLPKTLLTAALYAATLARQPEEARRFLDEAQQIAESGPMPLHLADVHLHRARLFRDREELAKARALVEEHGYWRRREELEDAEAALGVE